MKNQLGKDRKSLDRENKQNPDLIGSSVLTKGKLNKEQIQGWSKLWISSFNQRYSRFSDEEFQSWLDK